MVVRFFVFFILSLQAVEGAKIAYFYPGFWGNNLFGGEGPVIYYNQDASRKLYQAAKAQGFDFRVANHLNGDHPNPAKPDSFDRIFIFDKSCSEDFLARFPKEKLILFLWEPPTTMPQNYNLIYHCFFSKIYTCLDELVDNKRYFKLHYPVLYPMIPEPVDFDLKKLCTTVCSFKSSWLPNELYSERHKLIAFLEAHHKDDFDLYGDSWGPLNYTTYKGQIAGGPENKIPVLKNYRFTITYENGKNIPGYITEKIFSAFQAGSVPIYYGAPNVTSYIPKNCFIAREDFESDEDLFLFLKTMERDEYEQYIANIQAFLNSPQAQIFTVDYFIDMILALMEQKL